MSTKRIDWFLVIAIAYGLACLCLSVGLVWVLLHFILKFW